MKKILFILPFQPYPLKSGGHQALFNGITAVKDDYDVYVTYPTMDNVVSRDNERLFLQKAEGIKLLPLYRPEAQKPSLKNRIMWKLHYLLRKVLGMNVVEVRDVEDDKCKWWVSTVSPLQKDWLMHIDKICNEYNFDIIQVEMPWMVSQVLTLPSHSRKVYVHHELGFVRRELEMKNMSDTSYVRAMKQFADMNEIALLNMYDDIITLSPVDADKLRSMGVTKPVHTSFATINVNSFYSPHTCDGKRLTFVGPELHEPNFVGITWFLENCWEKLKRIDSNYTLDIISQWTEKTQKEYTEKYPGVRFLGYVNNLSETLRGSVMIVPITVGSGIRMKILEACSNGIPFVSTTIGAEGIPVSNGKHCFIADKPDEFVDSIVKLQNIDYQLQFMDEAQKMVTANYSLEALKKNRMDIYNK